MQSQERLAKAYEVLRELFTPADAASGGESTAFYAPQLPPIELGSRLSATDLLSWWFRPPSGQKDPWESFFATVSPAATAAPAPQTERPAWGSVQAASPKALMRVLFPEPYEELESEDADAAVEVFYEFLHAFGRHDVEAAMEYVAEDYHTFENDSEVNRGELRNRLYSLLESLAGWDIQVGLSMVPEAVRHPYGIVIYAEIQIDGVHPDSRAKRNIVERRLVLLQQHGDSAWRIAALSPVDAVPL
jgi:ketosteroid isomerase-like protein